MLRRFTDNDVCKDVEAVCNKCGYETLHVIVAVADGKIAQVECKSCGSRHKYKPVTTARAKVKKDTRTTVAASTREGSAVTPARSSGRTAETKVLIPKVEANDREIRKYSTRASDFQLGDRIEHAKFGAGVVDEFPAPGKMYVTFQTERVLLIYGK